MAKKRAGADMAALMDDDKDMSFLDEQLQAEPMKGRAVKKKQLKKTKPIVETTVNMGFSAEDIKEIDRIEVLLMKKGIRVKTTTNIIRLALRVAFNELDDEKLTSVCNELSEKWRRGVKASK